MVNYHSLFRSLLLCAVSCPVYYEAFSEKTGVPCVSYMETTNRTTAKGDTLTYSTIGFTVKIWAGTIGELINLSENIDGVLQNNGFHRTEAFETREDDLLVKILRYEATSYERG